MNPNRLDEITGDYHEWLIKSLKNKKRAAMHLQAAIDEYQQDGSVEALCLALRDVAEAQGGIGQLSKKTKLNRESLYRTLSSKGNPKFKTLGTLLQGLGFQIAIRPV